MRVWCGEGGGKYGRSAYLRWAEQHGGDWGDYCRWLTDVAAVYCLSCGSAQPEGHECGEERCRA